MISLADFEETGALLTGHFRLSSGLHSDRYLQCARLLMWPERAERAGQELGTKLAEFSPAAVISPALGGVVIGHETARALKLPAMFVERKDGAFALRRGFSLEPGQPIVVVEDVFTTGKSTREAAAAVEAAGGRVVAVGSIVDRGLPPTRSRFRLDLFSRSPCRPGRRPSVRCAAKADRWNRPAAGSRPARRADSP